VLQFDERVTNKEEEIFFAKEPNLFTIGTITLLNQKFATL
jgi:hypothetical protein